jgi:catechol 2,3-dioxygenase-like lactoylglutathione lyase family enzyme
MRPFAQKLDHVALYVSDASETAALVLAQLPFRVLEETDEFVLVGRDLVLGKLTLFHAEGPREAGVLRQIGIGIPGGTAELDLEVGDGLQLGLTPTDPGGEVEVTHVRLLAPDPAASAREWLRLGLKPAPKGPNGAVRVRIGREYLELVPGSARSTERPLLNHLGVLVESFDDLRRSVDEQGLDVNKVVDAENSRALFVRGPDGVELEYIEHKHSLALA